MSDSLEIGSSDAQLVERLRQRELTRIEGMANDLVQRDNEAMESISTESMLMQSYGEIGQNIWSIHLKQWRRGMLGRAAMRVSGRIPLPLSYYDDPSYFDNSWYEPDIFVSTPSLLKEDAIDTQSGIPLSFGWSFAVSGELPEAMIGNAPLIAYLGKTSRGVTVSRVAQNEISNDIERSPWYTISSSDNRLHFIRHADAKELSGGKDAKMHALALAKQSLPILNKGY